MLTRYCLLLLLCCAGYAARAIDDSATIAKVIRQHMGILAADNMGGRGYVPAGPLVANRAEGAAGVELAAAYISDRFKEYGLATVPGMREYGQWYGFPVNTFPGKMQLEINGAAMSPGQNYLTDAASASYRGTNLKVRSLDLAKVKDVAQWKKRIASMRPDRAWVVKNKDVFCKKLGIKQQEFASVLPPGCYIIPQVGKLMWTVATDTIAATVLYASAADLPGKLRTIKEVAVESQYIENFACRNLIGLVPGTVKDSFIVFSAHYDHLGKMGAQSVFPGASDNASGIAMLLYLAAYYAQHPQRYSMVFIAFSGEEAGLLGSAYFVKNPPIPLGNIKFLTNVDIMGDATDGVTVVNATEYPVQFGLLTGVNKARNYLPVIKSRGKAANSDHYYFSEAGVPAIFMYSNGGKGYYHDIYDKPEEVTLNNIPGVAGLLIEFTDRLQLPAN